MDQYKKLPKDKLNNLPTTSGVYLFLQKNEPIYIGKAINIKDRVKNHFLQPTYKDPLFTEKTDYIGFIETGSEIEALVLEASLIKKHQPKFNAVWRDDKNYFYVAITKGPKPIVFITHQPHKKFQISNFKFQIRFVGPFTEGNALKKTLKFLRRVFPFYTTAKHPNKPCTWCHLGLCPGENPNLVEYKKNIKKLTLILQGKRKTVLYSLKKEMAQLSKTQQFEKAKEVRDKIMALEQVMAHTHVIATASGGVPPTAGKINQEWIKTERVLQEILGLPASGPGSGVAKIECYDISNIQGTQAVGSMVVFVNGKPDKSQYKKFRISPPAGGGENTPNDIAMLKEVLTRRLGHPEWGYPDVMLIDGGIAQLNVGIKTLRQAQGKAKNNLELKNIKIISIAKGKRELLIEGLPKLPLKELPQEIYNLIVHLDDEAHRFAITYHKKLRKKYLLT